MQAVVEVPAFDVETPFPWPVAPMTAWSWLALTADCTDQQVGLFVAALADPLDVPSPGVPSPGGRDGIVDTVLAQGVLSLPGGLRLIDTVTGTSMVPGCCAGLEDWRDWLQVIDGASPWLGHDPRPEVEVTGAQLRMWQNGRDRHSDPAAGSSLQIPRMDLPGLLMDVQRDLLGFIAALDAWGTRIGLDERGDALVEAVDHSFAVRASLNLPAG